MRIKTQPEGLKHDLGVFRNKARWWTLYLQLSDHVMCLSTQTIEASGPACFSVYVVSGASQLICLLKIMFVRTLLHDGSVDDRFDVVLPITGVDHPLSF